MKKISYDDITIRIGTINPKITIDKETYINTTTKCRMFEVGFGEFWCQPKLILSGKQKGHPDASREKIKGTCRVKYGSDHFFSSDIGKKHLQDVFDQKYQGNPSRDTGVKSRRAETCKEKYGSANPHQNQTVINKTKKTNLERYGTSAPLQNQVVKDKMQQTNLERYGAKCSMQNEMVFRKNLAAGRHVTKKNHWLTQEVLLCKGSYESKVVDFLNKNQINFMWQIPFKLPSGKLYVCDLLIVDSDIYIEIKGYWRGDAKNKWDEFVTTQCKKCDVWDKNYLKRNGII